MFFSLLTSLASSLAPAQHSAPVVAFSAVGTQGSAPLTVQFQDESRGQITSWSWDFGDGTTSSERNPTHLYTAPGSYSVALRASSRTGTGTRTHTQMVAVSRPTLGGSLARPNVVLLVLDDIGVDRIGAYGEAPAGAVEPCTPNLDALAANGLLFRNCYANPLCSPTRAQILTGRHGFRTGVGQLVDAGGSRTGLSASFERTLPEILGTYDTSLIGKWHLGSARFDGLNHPLRSGFRYFAGSMYNLGVGPVDYGTGAVDCTPFGTLGYYNWVKTQNVAPGRLGQSCSPTYATTDAVDEAVASLFAMQEPWFLEVAVNAAHLPPELPPLALCPTPGTCATQYCQIGTPTVAEALDAMVEALDRELGRLIASVQSVDPDAYIFVISDNGSESMAARGAPGSCFGPDRSKGTLFQGGIRVPLLVVGPTVVPGECTNLVQATDLFATIADLTHSAATAEDSISFEPYLRGRMAPRRAYAYSELFTPNFLSPDKSAAVFQPKSHLRAVTDGHYKLIRYSDQNGLIEDYYVNLLADPCELVDLSPGFGPANTASMTPEQQSHYLGLRGELQRLGVD
ncbi:MAG: sulfatase-like hydrolase/transferase [Planctomycetota bacterium]